MAILVGNQNATFDATYDDINTDGTTPVSPAVMNALIQKLLNNEAVLNKKVADLELKTKRVPYTGFGGRMTFFSGNVSANLPTTWTVVASDYSTSQVNVDGRRNFWTVKATVTHNLGRVLAPVFSVDVNNLGAVLNYKDTANNNAVVFYVENDVRIDLQATSTSGFVIVISSLNALPSNFGNANIVFLANEYSYFHP